RPVGRIQFGGTALRAFLILHRGIRTVPAGSRPRKARWHHGCARCAGPDTCVARRTWLRRTRALVRADLRRAVVADRLLCRGRAEGGAAAVVWPLVARTRWVWEVPPSGTRSRRCGTLPRALCGQRRRCRAGTSGRFPSPPVTSTS